MIFPLPIKRVFQFPIPICYQKYFISCEGEEGLEETELRVLLVEGVEGGGDGEVFIFHVNDSSSLR